MVALLLVVACGGECLGTGDPAIDAPGHEATVRQTLADFASWIAPAGVCIAKVRAVEGPMGRYNPVTRRIHFDPRWPEVGAVLRHELCHALQGQTDIASDDAWLLDASRLDQGDYHQEQESFATWCALGAPGLAMSTHPAALAVLSAAYPGFPSPVEAYDPDSVHQWRGDDATGEQTGVLLPGESDTLLVFLDTRLTAALDLHSGEVVPEGGVAEIPAPPVFDLAEGWHLGIAADDPTWGWLATAGRPLPDGSDGVSWVVARDGAWIPVASGEERPSRQVITSSDGAWGASLAGQRVEWFRW